MSTGIVRYVASKILSSLWTLLILVTLTFLMLRLAPGDPAVAYLGDRATPELLQHTRERLGIDRPVLVQYTMFIRHLLVGDLGISFYNRRPVAEQIGEQFKFTVMLAASALLIAVVIGVPLGVIAGFFRGSYLDLVILTGSVLWVSVPGFWLALMLLVVFSVNLGWFPMLGAGDAQQPASLIYHLILPAFALGIRSASLLARMTRSAVADVMNEDYVRTARSKGVSTYRVASKHVLRNVMSIVISMVGLELSLLLGGVVVIEKVFSRQGIGSLTVDAILARDYPMVQGLLLFIAFIVIVVHIATDVAYAVADPRIRYES